MAIYQIYEIIITIIVYFLFSTVTFLERIEATISVKGEIGLLIIISLNG